MALYKCGGGHPTYILTKTASFNSVNGTTLKYKIPDELKDTTGYKVAFILPISYGIPYVGVGYTAGPTKISATIRTDRTVWITIPQYSTNRAGGVDDEFSLTMSSLTIALVYVG